MRRSVDKYLDARVAIALARALAAHGSGLTYWHPIATAYFVDPQNESGHASDTNNGLSALSPFLTTERMNEVLFFGQLTGDTTIRYLSDDNPGSFLDFSLLNTSPGDNFSLFVQGTPQVLKTGGTIAAGTLNVDPTTEQTQVVATSDVADWSIYAVDELGGSSPFPVMVHDTTHDVRAWVGEAAAGSTALMGDPKNADFSPGVFTIGDHYELLRGSWIAIRSISAGPDGIAGAVLRDFTLRPLIQPPASCSYERCGFTSLLPTSAQTSNCFVYGFQVAEPTVADSFLSGGIFLTTLSDLFYSTLVLADDVCVKGQGLVISASAYASVVVTALFSPPSVPIAVQFQKTTGPAAIIVQSLTFMGSFPSNRTNALLWGTGNALGALIHPGTTMLANITAGFVPTVTGAAGDFGFLESDFSVSTSARAWDETTGTWSAPFAASWADLADPTHHHQAQSVGTAAAVLGITAPPI